MLCLFFFLWERMYFRKYWLNFNYFLGYEYLEKEVLFKSCRVFIKVTFIFFFFFIGLVDLVIYMFLIILRVIFMVKIWGG